MINPLKKLCSLIGDAKLRTKLFIGYVSIIALGFAALCVVLYLNTQRTFTDEVRNKSFEIIKQVNSNIEDNIKEMDLLINYLYLRKDENYNPLIDIFIGAKSEVPATLLHRDWEFNKLFEDLIYLRNDFSGIFMHGDNGIEFSRFNYGSTKNYNIYMEWYGKTIKNKGKTTVLGTHKQFYSDSGMLVFSVAKQIENPANKRGLGVILLDFDLSMLRKECQAIDILKGSRIIISDGNYNTVYQTDEAGIMEKIDKKIIEKIDGKESVVSNIELAGGKYLLVSNTSARYNWKMIALVPMEEMMRKWKDTENIILIVVIPLLIMIFIVSYILARRITKPISRLINQMEVIEKGDYNINWVYPSRDEVGQLSRKFVSMVSTIRELIRKEYKASLAEREAELKALQAQINPHFIYNTLELISTISIIEKVPQIDEVALALARMLRYSIKTKDDVVTLGEELHHVEDYLRIYNSRFDYKIDFVNKIEKQFYNYGILKLTIQPIIENAVVHGIEKSERDGLIVISAEENQGILSVNIIDNGSGIEEEKLKVLTDSLKKDADGVSWELDGSQSIGLKNVNARLSLYYGKSYGINISSEMNKYTKITLKIPAQLAAAVI